MAHHQQLHRGEELGGGGGLPAAGHQQHPGPVLAGEPGAGVLAPLRGERGEVLQPASLAVPTHTLQSTQRSALTVAPRHFRLLHPVVAVEGDTRDHHGVVRLGDGALVPA